MNNLEIEFPRLIQFEKTFHKTTALLLLLYGIVSVNLKHQIQMYYIYDFSVSIYELLYLSCDGIQNGISLISDALFWVASFILYWAIKQLSLKRFKKYFYTMGSLITLRLGYAFTIMVDDHSCKVTIRQKIVGIYGDSLLCQEHTINYQRSEIPSLY
ncbi:hypothetical protein pb186bvf_017681 [Paramecium bursaria]